MSILVINAGSTSLKFGLYEAGAIEESVSGNIDWADGNRERARFRLQAKGMVVEEARVALTGDYAAAAHAIKIVAQGNVISAVGHRVVHGGTQLRESCLVNSHVKQVIGQLADLAPLHNPPALAAIEATEARLPDVPQVAVFDTAFFAKLPPRAYLYALPYEWAATWGARRFGFHGISNAYCAVRATELLDSAKPLRLVTCHLGGGCSATAVAGGVPVATTMGFSPIEGLIMGTRSGAVDPGLLLHLLRRGCVSLDELDRALNYQSGLLGLSGLSSDLGQIEAAARHGNERAQLAFDLFADRVRSAIGALSVTMNGLDALVFTDRIGENSPALRAAVCQGLECLGVRLDPERNLACRPDMDIASASSGPRVLVMHTREELMIARETAQVIASNRNINPNPTAHPSLNPTRSPNANPDRSATII